MIKASHAAKATSWSPCMQRLLCSRIRPWAEQKGGELMLVLARIYLLAGRGVRVSLYIRLSEDKHRRFSRYARRAGISANQAAEMLVDQVLAQTDPTFEWPDWLVEAVEGGLPIQRPASGDEEYVDEQRVKPVGLRAV